MIKIGEKEFRNIQEQVEKNKQDIEFILEEEGVLNEFGIKVIGQEEYIIDLPSVSEYKEDNPNWAYGDAYAIGTEAPYELYILTRANGTHPNDYWFEIGQFPMPGPQGEQGETGPQGEQGEKGDTGATGATGAQGPRGYSTRVISEQLVSTVGAYTEVTVNNGIVHDIVISKHSGSDGVYGEVTSIDSYGNANVKTLGSLRGPQGQQGAQGIQGIQGETGPAGEDGQDGVTPSITAQASVGANTGTPTVSVTKSGTDAEPTFTFAFDGIKGEQGIQGIQGIQGPQGPQGIQGPQGEPGTSMISVEVVNSLPATGDEGTIYFVPKTGSGDDNYDEYIYTNGDWELLGSANIDLSNYVTLNTSQTISGAKEFSGIITVKTNGANDVSLQPAIIAHRSNTGTEIQAKVLTIQDISQGSTPESVLTLGDEYTHIVLKAQDVPVININGVDKTIATTDQIPDVSNMVTTDTTQTITGAKTLQNELILDKNGTSASVPSYKLKFIDKLWGYEYNHYLYGDNLGRLKYDKGGTYGILFPEISSTANKTLATTDQISNMVTTDTAQTITGEKTFTNDLHIGNEVTVKNIIFPINLPNIKMEHNGQTSTYSLQFPNISNFTTNKTIATTDDIQSAIVTTINANY